MVYYHYTVAPKLPSIIADGRLKPTTVNLVPGEAPILWWSTNPVWERTAAKGDGRGGVHSFETHRDAIGLCRFVLNDPSVRVYPFKKITVKAKMPPWVVYGLIGRGEVVGANYLQWHGTLKSVLLRKLVFETCTQGQEWRTGNLHDFIPNFRILDLGPIRMGG